MFTLTFVQLNFGNEREIRRVHNYDNYAVCIIQEGFSGGNSKNFKTAVVPRIKEF